MLVIASVVNVVPAKALNRFEFGLIGLSSYCSEPEQNRQLQLVLQSKPGSYC